MHLAGGQKRAALAIRVTPRAARDEIVEILKDETVKVRLKAPPVEGKANLALIKLLSKVLGVPKSGIEIVSGATGRDKLVSVLDLDPAEARARILKQLKS